MILDIMRNKYAPTQDCFYPIRIQGKRSVELGIYVLYRGMTVDICHNDEEYYLSFDFDIEKGKIYMDRYDKTNSDDSCGLQWDFDGNRIIMKDDKLVRRINDS